MTDYEVDWVAPLAGPIHPPKHISLPPPWRTRGNVSHDRMHKSKSQCSPNGRIRWSTYEDFNDASSVDSRQSKSGKQNKLLSSIIRSMSNFLKGNKKMDISSPFNFLHCGHAGVDPVTQEIVGLPRNTLNLVPLNQIITPYPHDKPLPPIPDERVTPKMSSLPRRFRTEAYDRVKLRRSTTCTSSASLKRDSDIQRWSLQSNRDERLCRRASSLRSSVQSSTRSRKNLEISSPFNPIHVAHISFTKDGALVAMPQSWRQSLAYEI